MLAFEQVNVMLADFGCASLDIEGIRKEHPEKKFFLQLPDVLREKKAESVKSLAEKALRFDGVVIKNQDEIGLLKEVFAASEMPEDFAVIGDSFLYAYNSDAVAFYKSFYPQMKFVLSDELTDREAAELIKLAEMRGAAVPSDFIYKAYGFQPLMITNQCMNRNYAGCAKPLMEFADEKRNHFYISSECGQCYDIVYNGQPTVMLDKIVRTPNGFNIAGYRYQSILLDFTIESEEEIDGILWSFFEYLEGNDEPLEFPKLTRGHHAKGVE